MGAEERRQFLRKFAMSRPRTPDELHDWVYYIGGVYIPRTKVCENHIAPFDAFCMIYFETEPGTLIKGSRGVAGKTFFDAVLAWTLAITKGAIIKVLGGSEEQSKNVQGYLSNTHKRTKGLLWESPFAPTQLLAKPPTQTHLSLKNGGEVEALRASQQSVRGPHPQILILDEIDEMERKIFDSATGQPMAFNGIRGQLVCSSTHQNVGGTFEYARSHGRDKGWNVVEWCIGSSMRVLTRRGNVPIKSLNTEDQVMTRKGWRKVVHVTKMGHKKTISLNFADGRALRCTPEHRVATRSGWLEAGLLQPVQARPLPHASSAMPSAVGRGIEVGSGVGMSGRTMSFEVPPIVTSMADRLSGDKVSGSDAVTNPASVVNLIPVGYEAIPQNVGDAMYDLGIMGAPSGGADSVTVGVDGVLPEPTSVVVLNDSLQNIALVNSNEELLGIKGVGAQLASDGLPGFDLSPAFTESHVETITHGVYEDVYDIGVEGEHEFVVEGVVVHNCYKETTAADGFVTEEMMSDLSRTMPDERYRIEVLLQEPSHEGRIFDDETIEFLFDKDLTRVLTGQETFKGAVGEEIIAIPPPIQDEILPVRFPFGHFTKTDFSHGTDWGNRQDKTVVLTMENNPGFDLMAAYGSWRRSTYHTMADHHNLRVKRYGGPCMIDGTGLGAVMEELMDVPYEAHEFSGQKATRAMYNNFINSVQKGEKKYLYIESLRDVFRYLTAEHVYTDKHTPDQFVAAALEHKAREESYIPAMGRA